MASSPIFQVLCAKDGHLIIKREWNDERGFNIVLANYKAGAMYVTHSINGENVLAVNVSGNEASAWKYLSAVARG